MSWVPRISRSATTNSYSSFFFWRSFTEFLMMVCNLEISVWKFFIYSLFESIYFFFFSSSRLCSSRVWSFFLCSNLSFASATSLASIYYFNWLIWWFTILYLLFVSAISSSVSDNCLLYLFLSDLTVSYSFCCSFNLFYVSIFFFWYSEIRLPLSFISYRDWRYLALASAAFFP